jgi:hypothetical protein
MHRLQAGIIGLILWGSQLVFAEPAPVKYLTGQTEAGQPHLYWFGAAAVESTLAYDDGVSDESVYVAEPWDNNQVLMRFGINVPFFQLLEVSAFAFIEYPSDTGAYFALTVRRDSSAFPPESFLFQDTVGLRRGVMDSGWISTHPNVFFAGDTSFWGAVHWLSYERPTNPRIGEDRSDNSGRTYIGYGSSYFVWSHGGDRMLRAKALVNNPTAEAADSFWVYRFSEGTEPVHIVTIGPGQFDYMDLPPSSGNYYYQVSRWEGDEESSRSSLIGLSASPTAVEDRDVGTHAFLLSEPFPNPTSTGVLFTARTDKQMELGFTVYNLLGQKVFSKAAGGYPAGEHRFFWNGQDASGRRLSSGLYLLRFQAGEEILVKKVTLLR